MPWQAYARFVQHCGRVFRVETELRRPDGRGRVLGAVVMINPGSSRPLGALGEMAPATLDDTMRAVVSVVEGAYQSTGKPLPLAGHLAIHNLFNLCEADSLAAIAILEGRYWRGAHPIHSCHVPLPAAPWVWCAWGAEKNAIRPLMLEWMERLERLPRVGIRIPSDELGYYHPAYLKRMRRLRPELRQEIVGRIGARIELI